MARQPFKPPTSSSRVGGKMGSVGGKKSASEMLPSRYALSQLTGGDPSKRTLGYYGKLTPLGAGAPAKFSDIQALGENFKKRFK